MTNQTLKITGGLLAKGGFTPVFFATVVYFSLAIISQYFPQITGIETPIWPATGGALAMVLLLGNRIWPGIFIGNICANLYTSTHVSSFATIFNIVEPDHIVLAFGATIQVTFAAYIVRKMQYFPNNLNNPKSIIRFYLLIGPLASLFGSTICNIYYFLNGSLQASNFFAQWLAWWLGDIASVLIFTTIGLALFLFDAKRALVVTSTLLSCFFITSIVYSMSTDWDQRRLELLFEKEIILFTNAIDDRKKNYGTVLIFMNGLASKTDEISIDDFHYLSQSILPYNPSITGITWSEIHPRKEKTLVEKQLSNTYGRNITLWEIKLDGIAIPTKNREEHIVIKLLEPKRLDSYLGYDLAAREIDTNTFNELYGDLNLEYDAPIEVSTPIITPLQLNFSSVAFSHPNFHNGVLRGYSSVYVNLSRLFDQIIKPSFKEDFNLSVFTEIESDEPDAENPQGVIFSSQLNENSSSEALEIIVPLYNRSWKMVFNRSTSFDERNKSIQPNLMSWIGMIICSLISVGTVIVSGQRLHLKRLVDKRTADLIKANKTKSEFVANMSHDLRTPLNAIIGFSEIINAEMFGKIGSPKYKGYVKDIYDSSQYLLALINDILDLSSLDSGKRELKKEKIDNTALLEDCFGSLLPLSSKKNIKCSFEIENDLPEVFADERGIKQIFINLISNSIKFTPDNGKVSTRVFNQERWIVYEVSDNGSGIDKGDIEKIIDPFSRVENNPHIAHQEGTGLGLAIVNSLVRLHGGILDIKSEQMKGTCVTVKLPV